MNYFRLGPLFLSLTLALACESERPDFGAPVEGGEPSEDGGTDSSKPKPACDTGLTRCGGVCVSTQQEGEHCGGCDMPCSKGRVCQGGSCELSCSDNATLCGNSCVETTGNPQHCGGCDQSCAEPTSGGKAVCAKSACSIECEGSLTECLDECIDTGGDNKNCGGCGVPCSGECVNGSCCPSDRNVCDGACVDLSSSAAHCGQCGKSCDAGQVCENGTCATDCQSGDRCGDDCVDLSQDLNHCGRCGEECKPPAANGEAVCAPSGCDIRCNEGNLKCGAACCDAAPANSKSVCQQNSCQTQCDAGYHACNGAPSVCYADSDAQRCGASCQDCTQLYANSACTSDACANTCQDADLGCDSAPGKPTCGRWDFESKTVEGWAIDQSVVGTDRDAASGVFETSTKHATNGERSLVVGFKRLDSPVDQTVNLTWQLCSSGQPADLAGRVLSMDVYAETAAGSTPFREGNGTAHLFEAYNGTTLLDSCDFYTEPGENENMVVTCGRQLPAAVTHINLLLRVAGGQAWTGRFYFDNVRFE